jgi:hypothetical protein
MNTHTHDYTALYYENGWLEIRESTNHDGWIATDRPVDVVD